jgi:hypothetical protein
MNQANLIATLALTSANHVYVTNTMLFYFIIQMHTHDYQNVIKQADTIIVIKCLLHRLLLVWDSYLFTDSMSCPILVAK